MGKLKTSVSVEQSEPFLNSAYARAVLPGVLSILSGNINLAADSILIGKCLGSNGLAAILLSLPVHFVLCAIGSFIVSGTAVCAWEAMKSYQFDRAELLYQTGIFWCSLISAAVMAAGLLCLEPLTMFLCGDEAAAVMVMEYVGVCLAGALPEILICIPFWYLGFDGRNEKAAEMMAVMTVGNILLDMIFLYVLDMGMLGAAMASVISVGAACILGFVRLCDEDSSFIFGFGEAGESVPLGHIARAGSSLTVSSLFQALGLMLVGGLFLKSGREPMPAAVCLACVALGMVPALLNDIASGYCSISGHVLWANIIGFLRMLFLSAASLLLFYFGRNPWCFLFLGEAGTLVVWSVIAGFFRRFYPDSLRVMTGSIPVQAGTILDMHGKGGEEGC